MNSYFKLDAKRRAAIAASMPSEEPLMEHTPTPFPWKPGPDTISGTHTPTPWRAALESMGNTQTWAVVHVCSVWDSPEAEANAAFIVKACNAHDELVAIVARTAGILDASLEHRVISSDGLVELVKDSREILKAPKAIKKSLRLKPASPALAKVKP